MSAPADRLAKLLPLLGSDRDGEALSAARAIGRFLTSQGKDWHDLARAAGSMFGDARNPIDAAVEDAVREGFARAARRRDAEREAEARARAAAWEAEQEEMRQWQAEKEARLRAAEEAERARWNALTPEQQEAEREAKREARRQEREERKAREEAKREAMGATYLNEANRLRLKETIRWCLDQWGDRPQDMAWHYLARASEAVRIGAWNKVNPKRVAEIWEGLRPKSKPEKPRRKRRSSTTA